MRTPSVTGFAARRAGKTRTPDGTGVSAGGGHPHPIRTVSGSVWQTWNSHRSQAAGQPAAGFTAIAVCTCCD